MSADWEKLKDLFAAALDRPPEERSVFVHQACNGDQALEDELKSLLEAHQTDASPLTRIAGSIGKVVAAEIPIVETPAVELGRRIGPYKVIRQIGHGGMAAVYLAARDDEVYRKQVAIKIVSAGLENAEVLRRFRNERQTLAALDHPNIVKLLDAGSTEDGLPYLVMDYVEGKPIDEYCDSHRLPTSARLELFRNICSAVEYAHQNGVIHRDIKPANVLVAEDGSPRLLDFGIAKLLDSDRLAVTGVMTRSDVRPMTPGYASPEQVRGGEITYATDIYSLGVLLYKLLTGHAPYRLKSHTPMEMERMICDTDPQKPSIAVNISRGNCHPVGNEDHHSGIGQPVTRKRTQATEPYSARRPGQHCSESSPQRTGAALCLSPRFFGRHQAVFGWIRRSSPARSVPISRRQVCATPSRADRTCNACAAPDWRRYGQHI